MESDVELSFLKPHARWWLFLFGRCRRSPGGRASAGAHAAEIGRKTSPWQNQQ